LDKVLLTKEQAEAIESALVLNSRNYIVDWKTKNLFTGKREPLNNMELDTLIRALYVGYELEPSPEEKLAKIFHEAKDFYKKHMVGPSGSFHAGQLEGIVITLDLFNIQVKGVNC
jgi:hypothetical protein